MSGRKSLTKVLRGAILVPIVLVLGACTNWTMYGGNAAHTGYSSSESAIGVGNVGTLVKGGVSVPVGRRPRPSARHPLSQPTCCTPRLKTVRKMVAVVAHCPLTLLLGRRRTARLRLPPHLKFKPVIRCGPTRPAAPATWA